MAVYGINLGIISVRIIHGGLRRWRYYTASTVNEKVVLSTEHSRFMLNISLVSDRDDHDAIYFSSKRKRGERRICASKIFTNVPKVSLTVSEAKVRYIRRVVKN